jgi:hypothetical protein
MLAYRQLDPAHWRLRDGLSRSRLKGAHMSSDPNPTDSRKLTIVMIVVWIAMVAVAVAFSV